MILIKTDLLHQAAVLWLSGTQEGRTHKWVASSPSSLLTLQIPFATLLVKCVSHPNHILSECAFNFEVYTEMVLFWIQYKYKYKQMWFKRD